MVHCRISVFRWYILTSFFTFFKSQQFTLFSRLTGYLLARYCKFVFKFRTYFHQGDFQALLYCSYLCPLLMAMHTQDESCLQYDIVFKEVYSSLLILLSQTFTASSNLSSLLCSLSFLGYEWHKIVLLLLLIILIKPALCVEGTGFVTSVNFSMGLLG